MGNARETMATLRESRQRELRAATRISELPDREWALEPATGLLAPEPEIESEFPAPQLKSRSVRSSTYVWD